VRDLGSVATIVTTDLLRGAVDLRVHRWRLSAVFTVVHTELRIYASLTPAVLMLPDQLHSVGV